MAARRTWTGFLMCFLASLIAIPSFAQEKLSYSEELADLRQRIQKLEETQPIYKSEVAEGTFSRKAECATWTASFDILSMSARNAGFEFGITDIGGVQDRGAVGNVLTLGGDYHAAFRFTVGRQLGSGGPEMRFRYFNLISEDMFTYAGVLRSTIVSADNSENDDSDNINTLGVETVTPDDRATGAVAENEFSLFNYDIEFAQSFQPSEYLTIGVNSAIRIADLDTRHQVTYTGGDFQTPFTSFQTSAVDGAGIILGGDLTWKLTRHLSLNFGTNAGALLGRVQTRTFIPDDEPGVPTDVTYDETRLIPLIESRVSLQTQANLRQSKLEFAGGYEFVNMFNVADQRVFTDAHIEGQNAHLIGDISLDGFFTRITVRR